MKRLRAVALLALAFFLLCPLLLACPVSGSLSVEYTAYQQGNVDLRLWIGPLFMSAGTSYGVDFEGGRLLFASPECVLLIVPGVPFDESPLASVGIGAKVLQADGDTRVLPAVSWVVRSKWFEGYTTLLFGETIRGEALGDLALGPFELSFFLGNLWTGPLEVRTDLVARESFLEVGGRVWGRADVDFEFWRKAAWVGICISPFVLRVGYSAGGVVYLHVGASFPSG